MGGNAPICAVDHVLICMNALQTTQQGKAFYGTENAVTQIKFHLAEQPRSGLHWSDVKQEIAAWWHCARSLHELQSLDDRCLQDMGMSRSTSNFESAKPFWMA
jgi:uncharacterized protein YjiS (DUF1127 family)